MKRKIIFFFLAFVISSNAFALLPLLMGGARIVAAGFSGPSGQLYAAGTVLGIGTLVQSVYFSREGTDGSSRTDTIHYTSGPRTPRPGAEVEAGYTAGYPSVMPPTAGITRGKYQSNSYGVQRTFASQAEACVFFGAPYAGSVGSVAASFTVGGSCIRADGYNTEFFGVVGMIRTCDPGYTLSGTNCVLTDVTKTVTPTDGFCPIVRSGNSYSADPRDSDCIGGNSTTATPQFLPDGSFEISSADGRKVTGKGLNAAGKSSVTYSEPTPAGNTKTTTVSLEKGTDTSKPYVVIGEQTAETPGSGELTDTAPPSVTVDNTSLINAITNQMAQERAIADEQKAEREADRVLPVFTEGIPKEVIPVTFAGITFSSAAVCPPPISYSMLGNNYTLAYDPMCNVMSLMRPLFLALGAFAAAFIFMGAFKL